MNNIVLITFDSLRADHCGYCGYDRDTTQNMDSLAETGISFTNAVSPASRTNPSMAGIFTGSPMVYRGKVSDPQHSKYHLSRNKTIAEKLSAKGYSTAAFCPNAYSSRYYGFDRGFDQFEDFLFTNKEYQKLFSKHLSDSEIFTSVRNIRNLLRKEEAFRTWETYIDDIVQWTRSQEGPYFMWAFSLDTHFPYITPREHRQWSNFWKTYYYNWQCNRLLDEYDVDITGKVLEGIIDIYDDSIQYADKLIGELQSRLEEEDTIFVICADHGEALGERGMYGHFHPSLYEENVHVPLVIGGDINQDTTVSSPVPLTELPNIITQLAENGKIELDEFTPAVSSTFDGRRNRNLISIKYPKKKAHLIQAPEDSEVRIYNVSEGQIESDSYERDLQCETTEGKDLKVRLQHEYEMLRIRQKIPEITSKI